MDGCLFLHGFLVKAVLLPQGSLSKRVSKEKARERRSEARRRVARTIRGACLLLLLLVL